MKDRFTSIFTALSGAVILLALFRFGRSEAYGDRFLVVSTIGLLWTPLLMIFLVFRSDPDTFGMSLGDSGRVARFSIILYVLLLLLLIPASQMKVFRAHYQLDQVAVGSAAAFLYYAATFGLYVFCVEFFYRGFLLFGLRRSLGWAAVLLQAAAFCLMHYGKSGPELVASFVSGLVLGWIATRARSVVPGFLLHWSVALTFQAMVIGSAHFLRR